MSTKHIDERGVIHSKCGNTEITIDKKTEEIINETAKLLSLSLSLWM